jgi:hypothetical protein
MTRDLQKRIDRLRQRMDQAFLPLDPKLKDERLAKAKTDDFYFYQTYLPHLFNKPSPDFHRTLSAAFDQPGDMRAYAAPRHFGKTVISQGKQIKSLVFGQRKHILGISASQTMVEELCAPLKIQIADNPQIRQDFGDVLKEGGSTDFTLFNGSKYAARGRGQAIRGMHPDLIVLDDVETDNQAADKDQTDKLINWVLEVLYPMLPPNTEGGGGLVIIGTVLGRQSMLARFLNLNHLPQPEFPQVVGQRFQAITIDDQGQERSLWEDRWPLEYLYKVRERIRMRAFQKEFQNNPTDDDAIFQEAWFQGFTSEEFLEILERALA